MAIAECRPDRSRLLAHSVLLPAFLMGAIACGEAADTSPDASAAPDDVALAFLANLSELCGQAFPGVVTDAPETDQAFHPDAPMIMHVRECSPSEVRVPAWLGSAATPEIVDNASRTFVFTATPVGLDVRHDHRHRDGRGEPNSYYGGVAAHPPIATEPPSPTRQEFKRLTEEGVSTGWIAEIIPGERFLYGTQRDGEWRHRFEFDLTRTVPGPEPTQDSVEPACG